MNKLICLLVVGFSAVIAQENSMANMPKSLLECYNNTRLLDRNNRLPQNIPSLLAIIRKIEDNPELNMDLRTLSVALLHRFRQDGIVQNPFVPVQAGVTPYAPNGFQFHRHAETLRLIPGNAIAFPNNSISSVERCSLHAMLSSSIEILERGDEPSTCRTTAPYRFMGRFRKRSVTQSSQYVEDVETLTDEQLETMNNKNEPKDTGTDPNSWYPPLPPNHPDSARFLALPSMSKCPVENGVLKTEWGAVAGGPVLAGIAAGLQPQNVRLGILLKEEWQSRDALSSTTLDNKWIATIAGDLAEVALRQGPLADKPLTMGVDGHWNSSSLPRWYFLNANENLFLTAAEIRGDLDGLILASEVANWYSRVPGLKLSQILDMYYSDRGVFNATIRACNRKLLLTTFAPNASITEQTYRSALVLTPGVAKVTIDPVTIERFAVQATDELFKFIPSSLNDPTCGEINPQKQYNRISTDITIFLDTNWPFESVQPILAALLEKLDISKYNSNFTLMSAQNGRVMISSSDSILDFYTFNETQYSNFSKGFDLPKTFEAIRSIESRKLQEEKNRNYGGRNSEVILIMPYKSSISDTDKEYCLEQMSKLSEDAPDTNIFFLTHDAKDTWSSLVRNPSSDLFSVGVSTPQDISTPINGLLTTIKRVPRRLVNTQCGSVFAQSGASSSFNDYLEPSGVNFYRLHPNYFYSTDEEYVATVKIHGTGSASLTVCSSREVLHINSTSAAKTCETKTSDHYVSVTCADANYIHECSPLYISVSVNASSNGNYQQCTDNNKCRYPDMVKFTISYDNLVCVSGASSIALTPIIFLIVAFYAFVR